MSGEVRLGLFYDLLGLDEDADSLATLVYRARTVSLVLPALIMDTSAHLGMPLGTGSVDELRRYRERVATYQRLYDAFRPMGARALKGPEAARYYGPGRLRPMNDLDLVVPDEATVWRVVRRVADEFDLKEVQVSLVEWDDRYLYAGPVWRPADPFLDQDFRVEISTCALIGDLKAATVRPALPDDPVSALLLGIAEERFQRPFNAKDLVDVIMVLRQRVDLVAAYRAAEEYGRAPELVELLELAVPYVSDLGELPARLREAAEEERARRAAVDTRSTAATVTHGLLLRSAQRDWTELRLHEFEHGRLARTPVGDYLLVQGKVVERDSYKRALAELDRIGPLA